MMLSNFYPQKYGLSKALDPLTILMCLGTSSQDGMAALRDFTKAVGPSDISEYCSMNTTACVLQPAYCSTYTAAFISKPAYCSLYTATCILQPEYCSMYARDCIMNHAYCRILQTCIMQYL